jgi:hypothetical protein
LSDIAPTLEESPKFSPSFVRDVLIALVILIVKNLSAIPKDESLGES